MTDKSEPPEEIYLNGDTASPYFSNWRDADWSDEPKHDVKSVKYIRADMAEAMQQKISELEAIAEDLDEQLCNERCRG